MYISKKFPQVLFEKVFSPSRLKDNFTEYGILGSFVAFIFSQHLIFHSPPFLHSIPLPFYLHCFWEKARYNSYFHPFNFSTYFNFSIGKVFSSDFFQELFFIFDFPWFENGVPRVSFSAIHHDCLEFSEFYWVCGFVSDVNLENFSIIIALNISSVLNRKSSLMCTVYWTLLGHISLALGLKYFLMKSPHGLC